MARTPHQIQHGIIPAYAGSTSALRSSTRVLADHPRIRGEHKSAPTGHTPRPGSSPHTRGARVARTPHQIQHGIIPAYAGSTAETPRVMTRPRDHPRIRGEHLGHGGLGQLFAGSSPHTRGARRGRWASLFPGGIIPAYAGSTGTTPFPSARSWDHPRIRGEHEWAEFTTPAGGGSSPHTRGAHVIDGAHGLLQGIIPAYAGSTGGPHTTSKPQWDHPRIRGEHSTSGDALCMKVGSSPHTRGARRSRGLRRNRCRIIPAYAGSTTNAPYHRRGLSDHPRIRGEHIQKQSADSTGKGSSPHTRGARGGVLVDVAGTGIIPAYAGSTPR